MIGDELDIGIIELLDISLEPRIDRPFYTRWLARYLREAIEDTGILHNLGFDSGAYYSHWVNSSR